MALALLMDVHVPRAITLGLRLRKVNVRTAQEEGLAQATDSELLDIASARGRTVFSFDSDLLSLAVERQNRRRTFAGVIFAHPSQITVGKCIEDLEIAALTLEPVEMIGQVLFIPL